MKKIRNIVLMMTMLSLFSCSEFEPGGTATENLSGEWYVSVEVNEDGAWEDVTSAWLGVERITISTYNSAANVAGELIVDDGGNFWDFKGKVVADPAGYVFGSEAVIANLSYDSEFIIRDGRVTLGGGISRSGRAVDAISFTVTFSDDDPAYGFTYRLSGTRITGFPEDDY
jgi:hypothetical protein